MPQVVYFSDIQMPFFIVLRLEEFFTDRILKLDIFDGVSSEQLNRVLWFCKKLLLTQIRIVLVRVLFVILRINWIERDTKYRH